MTILNNNEISELARSINKDIESYAGGQIPTAMGITPNDEIINRAFSNAPLLQFLESKGRSGDVNTANVSFFKETRTNDAQFIAETADIPTDTATSYAEVPKRMKTLVAPFSISMMAQMGTDKLDLTQREIEAGYLHVENKIDYTLLNGDGNNNTFENIWHVNGATSVDAEGEEISEDLINNFLNDIVRGNGGHPDCIVTDFYVANQIQKLVSQYRRINDTVEVVAGAYAIGYVSPDGATIPIIVDENVPVSDDEHTLIALDSRAISLQYLMRPSVMDVPTKKLAVERVVASFVTAMNIAPFRCGYIEGIGTGEEDSGTGSP